MKLTVHKCTHNNVTPGTIYTITYKHLFTNITIYLQIVHPTYKYRGISNQTNSLCISSYCIKQWVEESSGSIKEVFLSKGQLHLLNKLAKSGLGTKVASGLGISSHYSKRRKNVKLKLCHHHHINRPESLQLKTFM